MLILSKRVSILIQTVAQMNNLRLVQRNLVKIMPVATKQFSSNPQKLPRFPVPPLQKTLEKYLQSVKPHLDECELENTIRVTKEFENGPAKKLQQLLEARAQKEDNWLSDWWLNVAYLEYRDPVVVYSSPGQVFPQQSFKNNAEYLQYIAQIISAAVDFKNKIDANLIPVEKMGKDPLDMSQYSKVYGTCRIPKKPRDELVFNPKSKHIVIVSNSNYYKLPVYDSNGKPLSLKQIIEKLEEIQMLAQQRGPSIGVLTSQNRDAWADAYSDLIKLGDNSKSIKEIQSCLFLVCLDCPLGNRNNFNQRTLAGLQLIHGMGSDGNVSNRWYDKTMQFIVSMDGNNGMTYEHSPSEGQPIAVLTDYIVTFIAKKEASNIPNASDVNVVPLPFTVDDKIQKHIKTAFCAVDKLVENLDLKCFQFGGYGKNFIKTQKLSPDSFVQMALQFAYYRIHGEPGAHYESASLRKFVHGRTETIRSCSVESVEFAQTMLNPKATDQQKADALKKAINGHKKYTVDALNGQGVDRHLLGLKLIAIENNLNIPSFYEDVAYTRSSRMRISSSQVASKCDGFMCYAPLVPEGYGCCYNPRDNNMNFGASAFNVDPNTSALGFEKALTESLSEMHDVLARTQKSKL